VVLAALVPAILYYVSVFTQVDLRAAKLGLEGLPRESLPRLGQVLKAGWVFFLPLVVLIYALFVLFVEPDDAGLYSTAALIIICMFLPSRRLSLTKFLDIARAIGEGLLEVLVVAAAAGLLIGVITITGLGFSFSLALVEISGGSFLLLLILAAAGAILLGMGMTVTAAYLLVVILIAPAIEQVGSIPPIAGHMFVFYFAVLSFLTPPVCLAVYTAASIADCNSMRTAVQSMRLAVAAYLVPFVFAYSPEILFIGSPLMISIVIALSIMGIFMISVGLEAYLLKSLGITERLIAILSGVGMMAPFWWGRVGGLALAVALLGINFSMRKKALRSSSERAI
jgi:TRAP transporter 4TM/12TM fusion protein